MKAPIKIIHIDADYRVVYILIREGVLIKSTVPLETALPMLKNEHFDLILFEPRNMAILSPQAGQETEDLFPGYPVIEREFRAEPPKEDINPLPLFSN